MSKQLPLNSVCVKLADSVFGSTLQNLCDRDKCTVPTFVLECITAVENKGTDLKRLKQ